MQSQVQSHETPSQKKQHAIDIDVRASSVALAVRRSRISSFVDITRASAMPDEDEGERSSGRSMAPKASMASGIINLAHTILGTGVLALPAAVANSGIVWGLIELYCGAALGVLSLFILGAASIKLDEPSAFSFSGLGDHIKPGFSVVVETAMILTCLGGAIGYLIIASTSLQASFGGSRQTWVVVGTACATPLALLRRMDALRLSSAIGLFIVLGVALLVFLVYFEPCDMLSPCGAVGDTSCRGDIHLTGAPLPTISSFIVFIYSFTCQQSMLPILAELDNPTPRRLLWLVGSAMAIVLPVYTLVSIFGYLAYGSRVESDVIDSLPHNVVSSVARVSMGVAVITSFPIQTFATRKAVSSISRTFQALYCRPPASAPSADEAREADAPAKSPSADVAATDVKASAVVADAASGERLWAVFIDDRLELVVAVLIIAVSFSVAMVVDDLGVVVSMTGSLGAASISMVFPGIFYAFVMREHGWPCLRIAAVGLTVVGVIVIPLSLTLTAMTALT